MQPHVSAIFLVVFVSTVVSGVSAQAGAFQQCGGQGWTGARTCTAGYTCTYSNQYYSQCLLGGPTPTIYA